MSRECTDYIQIDRYLACCTVGGSDPSVSPPSPGSGSGSSFRAAVSTVDGGGAMCSVGGSGGASVSSGRRSDWRELSFWDCEGGVWSQQTQNNIFKIVLLLSSLSLDLLTLAQRVHIQIQLSLLTHSAFYLEEEIAPSSVHLEGIDGGNDVM